MRKNLKSLSPVLWFVLVAFIISIFAVWGGAGRLGKSGGANTLAKVGKEKITVNAYLQNLRQRLEMMQKEMDELNQKFIQQLNIPQQILQQMIQQTLLYQTAQKMNIQATEEEIREKIMSYPVFQKDGKFVGFERYKKVLEWNRISVSEFEESLKKEIVINKAMDVLTSGITVTQQELWKNYKHNNETAQIEFAVLETDKVQIEESPSKKELKAYFEKNKQDYQIPEKRKGVFVFLDTEELKKEIKVEESKIEDYYKENKSRFKEPQKVKVSRIYLPYGEKNKEKIREQAQNILDRTTQGEDFGKLAQKYSEGEKAQTKGDWGFYEWKKLSSQEQKTIQNLSEEEVSGVVELEKGAAILKVTQVNPSRVKPLEEVKERISRILKDQKSRKVAEKKISQLQKRAKKEKSLEAAAQQLGYKVQKTGLIKKGESIQNIDPSGSISKALFNTKKNKITSPIYTHNGVSLAQLLHIEPPRQAQFQEVQDQVKKDFQKINKKAKALQIMKKLKERINGQSLEELTEQHDLEYKTVNKHKRGQYLSIVGENKTIDKLAFSLPLKKPSRPVEFEGGYVIVRPLDRRLVTKEEFEKNKKEARKNLLEEKRNRFFQSYINQLREKKKVKIKYDRLQQVIDNVLSRYGSEKSP
ncbi:SurA N-terminal domain-containing protein [bacterium]|nr:SurA N-terminal domain-containing protein [bacterium]